MEKACAVPAISAFVAAQWRVRVATDALPIHGAGRGVGLALGLWCKTNASLAGRKYRHIHFMTYQSCVYPG